MRSELPPHPPIAQICAALNDEYGSPRLGNKSNPLDELIYIILSTRTQESAYRAAYRSLRRTYPSWDFINRGELIRVEGLLRPCGLGRIKAQQIVGIIDALKVRFGRTTLAPLRQMSDEDAESFLVSLPGVASKVAKCVLMYSLARDVLPVDVHVHRVATRLGLAGKRRPDTSQVLIEKAVPTRLRYGFHVNCVAHGRSVCTPRNPRCEGCCIARYCAHYRLEVASDGK